MTASIKNRIKKIESKQSIHFMKPIELVFIHDNEDSEKAIDKVCKEKNISRDTHEFSVIHFISTKYADEQKKLGNWPLS